MDICPSFRYVESLWVIGIGWEQCIFAKTEIFIIFLLSQFSGFVLLNPLSVEFIVNAWFVEFLCWVEQKKFMGARRSP